MSKHMLSPNNAFYHNCQTLNFLNFWHHQSVVFLFVYEISREPLNGFVLNSHGRRVSSLTWTSLKVKVNSEGHQGQKTALFGPYGDLRVASVS